MVAPCFECSPCPSSLVCEAPLYAPCRLGHHLDRDHITFTVTYCVRADVDMYGRVDFSKFMLGFEEALAARTTQAERPPTPSAATNGYYATHGSSGITASDMLMRGRGDDFLRPVRPTSYTASGDARTFTEGHTNAGSYYSTHVPPSLKSHGDIVTWTQEHTAREWRFTLAPCSE